MRFLNFLLIGDIINKYKYIIYKLRINGNYTNDAYYIEDLTLFLYGFSFYTATYIRGTNSKMDYKGFIKNIINSNYYLI